MTQAFNPFAQPSTPQPVAAVPVQAPAFTAPMQAAAPQPAAFGAPPPVEAQPGAGGLDDPALQGSFSDPLFPHIGGIFGFQLCGLTGVPGKSAAGYTSEPAVAITVNVLQSNHDGAPLNTKFVFRYKYDWQNNRPVPGDQGTVHAKILVQFLRALTNGNMPEGAYAMLRKLFMTHFDTEALYVKLSSELRSATFYDKQAKVMKTEPRRRETWLPATAG